VEKEYGKLNVPWGDVLRFRRGNVDLPGNGAPSQLGAIRTVGVSAFKDGKVEGDTVTFNITADFGGNAMTIKYTGKINGNEIKLKSEAGENTFDWTAKKQ